MKIGEKLKRHRDDAMFTQEELGNRAGVSGFTISRIESNQVEPRVSTIRKIAGALGIEPEELTTRPKVTSWFDPPNAGQLDQELKARGFDLLAMNSDEFEKYAKDKSYREVARQAWAEWVEVRNNPELEHLRSLANHRVGAHLTYLPGPTAPARPSREFLEFVDELDDSSLAALESDLMPVERSLNKEGDPNFEKVGIHRFITGLKGQIRRGSVSAEKSLDRELQDA